MSNRLRAAFAALAAAAILAACGDGATGGTGTLKLSVTDAPVDGAAAVVVTFTGVELQPSDGERITVIYDAPRQIDLLALQGGLSAPLLDGMDVPAGDYAWTRLMVAADGTGESFVQLLDGSIHGLRIPSGDQSGLKLHGGVTVAAGGVSSFTVDFDLRKSLHDPQGGDPDYLLRPTLRLVDDLEVGTLTGAVDPLLLTEGCAPAVYVYSGAGTPPDDVGGAGAQPIASSGIVFDPDTGAASYTVGYLAGGAYTVAFTCQAAADLPDADDAIAFAPVLDATIVAGQVTTRDLAPSP